MPTRIETRAPTAFFAAFRAHPASVGETYLEHLFFALKFSFRLFGAGLAALIHALIPALFCSTASEKIHEMHADLSSRNASPATE